MARVPVDHGEIVANLSYAGMRAQNHPSAGWRALAFLFGIPGTLPTFFLVEEGGERAYGVDLPRADRRGGRAGEMYDVDTGA